MPFQNQENLILGEVNAVGDIVQPGLTGRQHLGHIDAKGDYRLVNGLQGNYFKDKYLKIENFAPLGTAFPDQENILAKTIRQAERQRAINGSEIPLIRASLTQLGLNGQGIKVGILDPLQKEKNGQWKLNSHSILVGRTVNDPIWGVAPGAQIVDIGIRDEQPESEFSSDNLSAFQAYLVNVLCGDLSQMSQQIQKVIQMRDPQLRILNITAVHFQAGNYETVLKQLRMKDENGYFKFPTLRAAILGNSVYGTPKQQYIAIQRFVDQLMSNSPLVQSTHQQYVETTRQAAQAGLVIVAGTGNFNLSVPYNIPKMLGTDFSIEAKSPYVISVAASDTNQTPGNRYDDMPAPFSSRGDGYLWNPTIAAPGAGIGISTPVGELGHNFVVSGTSYATPYVCGVIAMMLQRNPFLTFEQIKGKLQATAVKSPHYSIAEVGAGFLNPEAAVYA